jgi:sigma-B regulation protein RsbU (phosphoserine phosphatase)
MATMGQLLFRTRPDPAGTPTAILSHVNAQLLGNLKRGTFISGICAILDPAKHTLTAANAGHLPIVVWRSKAKLATTHRSNGPVLGVLPARAFPAQVAEEVISLSPGDRFVMLTDGLNEAMAPGQKEFGMEHLRQRLKGESDRSSVDFLKSLTEQLELHRGGGEQSDDITIVTARRLR